MSNSKSELFIMVGCEELPARLISIAITQLQKNVLGLLKNIEHGDVRTWTTPCRIAIAISDVASQSPIEEKLVTGPPADRAFKDGEPTKAAIGFARGKKVSVDALEIVDGPRGKVVGVRVKSGGESVVERIQKGLEQAVLGIEFDRSMKWDRTKSAGQGLFIGSQPLRWSYHSNNGWKYQPQNIDKGHRLSEGEVIVQSSQQWAADLEEKWVITDSQKRENL